jgi:uncharacterized membrane protein YeaQ/YmgE (transglycosylase-associated protein family)
MPFLRERPCAPPSGAAGCAVGLPQRQRESRCHHDAEEHAMLGLIGFIIIGIIAGYLGRLLMPGRQKLGFLQTAGLGMIGSLVGGVLGSLIFEGDLDLSAAGFIGSIIGVLIVLFVMKRMGKFDGR